MEKTNDSRLIDFVRRRLRADRLKAYALDKVHSQKLSVKITLIYAATLLVVLSLTSLLTTAGVYISFYHQAQLAMESSIRHTMEKLRRGDQLDSSFWAGDPMTQGVVLRVTDVKGGTIIENDPQFPPIKEMVSNIRRHPPFWASREFKLIETHEAMTYYKRLTLERGGQIFYLHFFKTITFEKQFLRYMLLILTAVSFIGLIFALIAGYLVSSRILKPIRDVTAAAQTIEAQKMDERLAIGKAKDEVTELADTFNHMLDRLQESFKQQQRFISDASHELRTPVTVIMGYADMLKRWGAEDRELLDEGITTIHSEAQNMQGLIEELLFLARADQNEQTLIKAPVELSEIIEEAAAKAATQNRTVEILINDVGEIFADKDAIAKMLRIFIDNAIKYSDGVVRIMSRRERSSMRVSIEDNGVGIAKEHHEKIFERFYRVDKARTTSPDEKTTAGLGLAIAKWIADNHEIKIELDSAPAEGTRITLTIPLALIKLTGTMDLADDEEFVEEKAPEPSPDASPQLSKFAI
ncbi:MAG: HAMP domain-containing protein [Selenomonadaceae bacterium]|nr:HAMP domain-containing protein [Selenomonadaceae bacterium]